MVVDILAILVTGARLLVAVAFVLSAIVAVTHWAIRRERVSPFGGWARFVRRTTDPLLRPIEARLVRAGANPQDAPIWLMGLTVVAGLVLIAMVQWLVNFVWTIYAGTQPGYVVPLLVHLVFELLRGAIIVLVLASWINLSRHSPLMRVVHALTDWLIEPLRRYLPSLGMFDISPLVAYLLLYFAEQLVMRGLF